MSSSADFILGIKISDASTVRQKKIFLYSSVFFNLGILFFFKYFNFFTSTFAQLISTTGLQVNIATLTILLPVGISFYTFQSLSYTIDIYFNKLKPERDYLSLLTYVSFFPQLVAGPIERAVKMLPQIKEKKQFNYFNAVEGLRLVLWGLFKKVVIADNLAPLVDRIFDPNQIPSGGITLLGAILFAFQIYGDFSGYSDMAVGLAKMIGFDLMPNFAAPYFSSSFTEFWRRWHISLSRWFRDYVYIPLGGNQKGSHRANLNILITFILSGLWHGAKATFLVWGFLHGFVLVVEKSIKLKFSKTLSVPFVFIITCLFWIPFRADSLYHLKGLLVSFQHFDSFYSELMALMLSVHTPIRWMVLGGTLVLFLWIDSQTYALNFNGWIHNRHKLLRYGLYYWLVLSILVLINMDIKPNFIYFQF